MEGDYRYKFQGQEKDPETGMEAFELRLWDNRIGRWLAPDPAGQYNSPYLGMGNNPISRIDPDGGQDCDCRGGFFKRLFNNIGDFFKNNFGKNRPIRSNSKRGRGMAKFQGDIVIPYVQGRSRGRDKIEPISTISSSGVTGTEPPCMKLVPVTETFTVGGINNFRDGIAFTGTQVTVPGVNDSRTGIIRSSLATGISDPNNSLGRLRNLIQQNSPSRIIVLFPNVRDVRSVWTQNQLDLFSNFYNNQEYPRRFRMLNRALNNPAGFVWGWSGNDFTTRNAIGVNDNRIQADFTILVEQTRTVYKYVPCNE